MTTKRQDDTAVKDKTEIKTQRPKMYKVLVLNDDYTRPWILS
jgi:ATP-dependent Clp protease adapter protein ClpS